VFSYLLPLLFLFFLTSSYIVNNIALIPWIWCWYYLCPLNITLGCPCLIWTPFSFCLQRRHSNSSHISLVNISLSSSGRYRCEVSAEGPSFQTVTDHGDMVAVGEWKKLQYMLSLNLRSVFVSFCVWLCGPNWNQLSSRYASHQITLYFNWTDWLETWPRYNLFT
jgi:hypothetical protein